MIETNARTISTELRDTLREVIEAAGGEYIGIRGDSVQFRERDTGEVCALYLFAANRQNVTLSLKDAREKSRAGMWEFGGAK